MKKTLTYAVAAIMACAGLVLILGLFLTGEKTSALSENPKTLLIAHRGYSSLYVENSLKAFEAAGKAILMPSNATFRSPRTAKS